MSDSNSAKTIEIRDLAFGYPGNPKNSVLDIPSWQIDAGQKVFLYGPSGSGKSTFLNILAGTLKPDSGTISIFGKEVSALSARQRDKFRAKHIGVVFQQFNLIPYLTVAQNIEAAAWLAHNTNAQLALRIKDMIRQLQLPTSLLKQQANKLSVGQQQRVAIARALINQPELLIVDEPTSALDTTARDSFMQLLLKSCEQAQSTLLFVSHDPGLQTYFDTAVSLSDINRVSSSAESGTLESDV